VRAIDEDDAFEEGFHMAMVEWFEFQVPGKVICAEHCVDSIGAEMDKVGGTKVLLVTDEGVEKAGVAQAVYDGMGSGSAEIVGTFNQVPPNSEIQVVHACYDKAKEVGADALISAGGGSVIDTAKAATILMVEGGDLLDHQSAVYTPSAAMPPHISVPTTAGTGSEATFAAVIADHEQMMKLIFQGPELAPTVAMLDPMMTRRSTPRCTSPSVTAWPFMRSGSSASTCPALTRTAATSRHGPTCSSPRTWAGSRSRTLSSG
jgi:alcohol dehydrogenase